MCTLYIHIRLLLCYRFSFHAYPPKHGSELRKDSCSRCAYYKRCRISFMPSSHGTLHMNVHVDILQYN